MKKPKFSFNERLLLGAEIGVWLRNKYPKIFNEFVKETLNKHKKP